jgi:hypothetical protein
MRTLYQKLLIGWLALAVLSLTLATGTLKKVTEPGVQSSLVNAAEAAAETTFHHEEYHPLWVSEKIGRSMIPRWNTIQW